LLLCLTFHGVRVASQFVSDTRRVPTIINQAWIIWRDRFELPEYLLGKRVVLVC